MPMRVVIAAIVVAVAIGATAQHMAGGSGFEVTVPGNEVTVVNGNGASGVAIQVSRTLFEKAPVATVAGAGDMQSRRQASAIAVALGAPAFLLAPGPTLDSLAEELDRLATESVVSVGVPPGDWVERLGEGLEVVEVPERLLESPQSGVDAIESSLELPERGPDNSLDSLMVLADAGPAGLPAAATARAAGARVLVADGGDPRASPEAIAILRDEPPEKVMAATTDGSLTDDMLRYRLEVAREGPQLPGGGQVLFPYRRMIALYGHPETPSLGALGDQPRGKTIRRARQLAASYRPHSRGVPPVPALEIIASVASQDAGDSGKYTMETPAEELRPWVEVAGRAGVYVVLDLQPGRSDFLSQARRYEDLLTEPHVGLALDPEWRLDEGQVHLEQIGSVDAVEINEVIAWLADLTRSNLLPQKLLLLHQFDLAMIDDRAEVDTSHDELAVLLHADGHGSPELKRSTWQTLNEAPAPEGLWWGWKNFYDEDAPLWSPQETMELQPSPFFISYQ